MFIHLICLSIGYQSVCACSNFRKCFSNVVKFMLFKFHIEWAVLKMVHMWVSVYIDIKKLFYTLRSMGGKGSYKIFWIYYGPCLKTAKMYFKLCFMVCFYQTKISCPLFCGFQRNCRSLTALFYRILKSPAYQRRNSLLDFFIHQ